MATQQQSQSSTEPSLFSGFAKEVVGTVKENVGWAIGDRNLETEGRKTRAQAEMELNAARAEQRAIGNYKSSAIAKPASGSGITQKTSGSLKRKTSGSSIDRKQQSTGSSSTGNGWKDLFSTIRKGNFNLKHVQTRERPAPFIPQGYLIKKLDRKPMFAELRHGGIKLRHVETVEKNQLHFEKGYKMRKYTLRKEINTAIIRGNRLRHVTPNDRSAPYIERFGKVHIPTALLNDIRGSKRNLRPVDISYDRSMPVLDKGFKLRRADRKPFLAQIVKGVHLKHVETCDRSGLSVRKGYHLITPIVTKDKSTSTKKSSKDKSPKQKKSHKEGKQTKEMKETKEPKESKEEKVHKKKEKVKDRVKDKKEDLKKSSGHKSSKTH